MTAMLIPQLLPLQRHGSTANGSRGDITELYTSSSASESELVGHQRTIPTGKKA